MNGKRLRTAAGMLGLCTVCFWSAGCGRKSTDQLETLRLEDGRGTEVDTADQDISSEKEGSEGTEETGDRKAAGNIQEIGNADAGSGSMEHIFVYVCGAVNTPGVYELEAGARLYEAIARAGGVREDGAEESINQAQAVSDGERLYIPTDEEVRQGLDAYLLSGSAGGDAAAGSQSAVPGGPSGSSAGGKVNINTASREELKTLNGIGDTRAGSIVVYRESNGSFGSIEDLMKVEGIKEGVFNKLKDDITVN
ncbi:helix-hairpin-helix domain-containing protein [Schaedlerella sp.]|uniref:helix-hairpin-helix domain-containing protein n=1 Tax=Schaedlerella sp. TaxID=2676057 RepID=UPI0035296C52